MKKILLTFYLIFITTLSVVAQTLLPIPSHSTSYPGPRGYYFTAPKDFIITGLRIPTNLNSNSQYIQVFKFNGNVEAAGTNITLLAKFNNITGSDVINTNIAISKNDIIGILGVRGNQISYGANPYISSIGGESVTLARFATNDNIVSGTAVNYFSSTSSSSIGRIEMYYILGPVITTTDATTITINSAVLGGNITNDNGNTVTERGIIYSTTDSTPEIGEAGVTKDTNGIGTGLFTENISGLTEATTYYYRAYAINSNGNGYGTVKSFTTLNDPPKITSIERYNPNTTNTSAATVTFKVTFDKDVKNVDATDFEMNSTVGGTINSVTANSATEYLVEVIGISNNTGTIGINLKGADGSGTNNITSSNESNIITQNNTDDYLNQAEIGQTFKATTNGTLTGISIYKKSGNHTFSGTADLKIYTGDKNAGGTLLGSTQSVTITSTAGEQKITLTTPPSVTNGSTYSFTLSNFLGSGSRALEANTAVSYTDGHVIFTGQSAAHVNFDLRFKIFESTQVDGVAIANTAPATDESYNHLVATSPTVTTTAASTIASTSATLAGNATADGGDSITERGIVYSVTSTNNNPEIGGSGVTKEANGIGIGTFTESITGLTVSTVYSFKAYAKNSVGTSYGAVQTFTTNAVSKIKFIIHATSLSATTITVTGSGSATTNGNGTSWSNSNGVNQIFGSSSFNFVNSNLNFKTFSLTGDLKLTDGATPINFSGIVLDDDTGNDYDDFAMNVSSTTPTASNTVYTLSGSATFDISGTATFGDMMAGVYSGTFSGGQLGFSNFNTSDIIIEVLLGTPNTAPTVTNVTYTGTLEVGQELTGAYTYADVDNDVESGSTFKWYRSDNNSGTNKTAITGATANKYTLVNADANKYISFEVTPNDGKNAGSSVESSLQGAVPKLTPTITFTNFTKTYGDANFDLAATSNSSGTITYSIIGESNGTSLSGTNNKTVSLGNAGNVTIKATLAADQTYTSATKNITLTVGKATITATADNKSKNYGDANPTFTFSYTGFKNSETLAVIDTAPTASSTATAITNVGNVAITASGGADNNYIISTVNGTLTIGKATITATADNKSKNYGNANPAFTFSYTGFKNSETLAVLDTEPTASSTATTTTNVGAVDINVAGGLDNNYDFSYVKGSLSIGKATLTVTADNKSKTYGDANPTFTISYSGFKNSETSAVLTIEPLGSSIATTTTNVGTVDIDVAGGLDNNYDFSYVKGTLTIGKANQIITFGALANKDSKDADFNLTATSSSGLPVSFASSDFSVATISGNTVSIVGAGTTVVRASQAGNANYNAATDEVQGLTILDTTKPTIIEVLTASGTNKTYGVGEKISIYVQFSEPITVTGTPQLTLETGATDRTINYKATSSSTVEFEYTVQAGDESADLDYVATNSLTLNGGTIKDASNNNAVLTLATPGTSGSLSHARAIVINASVPTASTTNTSAITQFTTTFNGDITSQGGSTVSERGFVYSVTSTNANPKLNGNGVTKKTAETAGTGTFSESINNLTANTQYSFTAYATNSSGTSYGAVKTVTTSALATPTITFANISKTYGDANFDVAATSNSSGTISYSIEGANTTLSSLSGANNATVNIGNVGSFTIRATQAADGIYTSSTKDIVLTINKATLTAMADDKSREFGENNPTLTIAYSGFKNGDTETVIDTKPITNTGFTKTSAVGLADISVSGGSDNNYTFNYVKGALTITKAPLTITLDNKTKVYGDANPTFTASYSGFKNGETATDLLTQPTIENFATTTTNVGTSNITAFGANDENYAFTYKTGLLTITKATLTATADDKSRSYGEANPTFTFSYTGFKNGETSTVIDTAPTASSTATTTTNAGITTITAFGGSDNNYSITLINGTLTIGKANQTITFSALANKNFGEDPFNLTATSSSGLPVSYTSSKTTIATISGNTVTIVAIGTTIITANQTGNSNYNAATAVQQSFEVINATPTITFANISKTYGDANFDLSATADSGGTISYEIIGNGNGTNITGKNVSLGNVGTVTIRATVAPSGVFIAGTKDIILTIDKATLIATADDKSREYGDANPTFTVSYSGFKNGDEISVLDIAPTVSTIAIATSNVGTADINITGASDNNYNITQNKGTLTITKATLIATANNTSKEYGDANPVFIISYSGFKNGETSTIIDTTPTAASSATKTTNVGTTEINVIGGSDNNYSISPVKGTLTIGKSPITITANTNQTKIYGESDPTYAYSITSGSLKNGDSFSGKLTRTVGENTGSYSINIGTLDIGSNYNVAFVSNNLSITKRNITVTADEELSKVTGENDPELTYKITSGSIINGDAFSGTLSREVGELVGPYFTEIGTLTLGNNYNITFVKSTFTISIVLTTGYVSRSSKGVVIAGKVSNLTGIVERGVVYSSVDMTPNVGEPNVFKFVDPNTTGPFTLTIDKLKSNTTYYFQTYVITTVSKGTTPSTFYGGIKSFKTLVGEPNLVSKNPTNGTLKVDPTLTISLTFDVDIKIGSGNILIKKVSDDSLVESIDITSGNITVNNSILQINPVSDLPQKTELYVLVPIGAVEDLSDNGWTGFNNKTDWTFTTDDTIDPTLTSMSPANNAVDIAVNTNIVATFNEDIKKGTGDLLIKKTSDDSIIGSLDVTSSDITISNNVVTINPSMDLPSETEMYVQVPNTAFLDLYDNPYAGISDKTTWKFTTEDNTSPTVNITSSVANPTNSAFTATITFSEDVLGFDISDIDVGNGTASNLMGSGAVYTATITPTTDGGVIVFIPENVVEDAATNKNEISNEYFVTYDATNPTVTITSPVTNPTNSAFTTTFTFSEDVSNFVIGDITLTNATASNFTATSSSVYTALITPTTDGNVTIDVAADVANDAATNGNTAANQFSTLYDATKPVMPVIVSIDDYRCSVDTKSTADNTLIFNGTAEANSTIEVFVNATSVGNTTANTSGEWIFDYTSVVLAEGTYSVTATATDAATNVSDLSSVFSIKVDKTLCQDTIVMKKKYGFSPNGDGVNDTWVIEDIELFPNNVVNIYNRSGKLVFTMKGYNNTFNGFSNKINSGKKLPVGAYYFTVEFNTPGAKPAKGWIYINY